MSDLVVQVVGGLTREPSRAFASGSPVGPLGVGSGGEWVVDGPGVGAVHTYLYFDGNTLMVATVPPNHTAVNGAPVGSDWTPLSLPCDVMMGGVRLHVQEGRGVGAAPGGPAAGPAVMDEEAATGYFERQDDLPTMPVTSLPANFAVPTTAPSPAQRRPPGPMAHRGAPAPMSDESTAYRPIEQIREEMSRPVGGIPAPSPSGMVGYAGPPASGVVPPSVVLPETTRQPLDPSKIAMTQAPGMMPVPQLEPPPGMMPNAVTQGKKDGNAWQTASTPRKIIYILLPIALVGTALSLLQGDPPPPPTKKPKTAKSAQPGASGSAPPASSGEAPVLPAAIGSGSVPANGPLLPAPARSASPKKPPFPPSKPPVSEERKAVDAVSAGNYAEAIAIYEKLSQQYPEVPTYREAVRVLKAKQRGK